MPSDLRIKVLAAHTPEELEQMCNDFLSKKQVKLQGFDFVADGLDKAYNMALLYEEGA